MQPLNFLKQNQIGKDSIAEYLKTSPEKLAEFEKSYQMSVLTENEDTDNFFDINAKQASDIARSGEIPENCDEEYILNICDRIVDELLAVRDGHLMPDSLDTDNLVCNDDLRRIPESMRPQLTGRLAKVDITSASGYFILNMLINSFKEKDPKIALTYYHLFRQGLDILDIDPITYEILGMNRNSIEHWFPALKEAVDKQDFFRVPETRIVKVPLPILQLTRLDYNSLTLPTLKIVDEWAMRAFDLDVNKTYFVKTGTYSSKFDFRNAKVTGEKEVRELGEYLLFIHHQANQMASPLSMPCIYGVSTTNHWVVREYIEDTENNPTIYKGLPLRTEYRCFVDMDSKEILGISPYWEPEMMKKRFSENRSIHDTHDYITFKANEERLMKRYNENKEKIVKNIEDLIKEMNLTGQWSIDIMQNGTDFWIIDMALAENSALSDCVPAGKLKRSKENWIPNVLKGENFDQYDKLSVKK